MSTSEHQFRIAEIEVARNPTDEKILGIFRYENIGATKQGPMLLIVAEIESTLYMYERLLDVINSTAEQARYLTSGVDQDPVSHFEKLVQRLNEAVSAFSTDEQNPISWPRVNIFVLELSKGHMCLTGIGKLMNMFVQKQDDGTFRSFDLFGSLEQPAEADPKKPFASLICGDMQPGDLFIAGSSNLDQLRTEIRLKERITSLPPVTAALEIKQDLERRSIPDHYIAAIISSHEIRQPVHEPKAVAIESDVTVSTASIQKLRETEEEAEHHLAPVISPIRTSIPIEKLTATAKSMMQKITRQIKRQIPRRAGEGNGKEAMELASLRGMNAGYGSIFTKKRKLVLAGIGAGLLFIGIGSAWWSHSKKEATLVAAWNTSFSQAQDNRNRAESDLIYGNEDRAKTELNTAAQLIASLPKDTPDRESRIKKINEEMQTLREKLKKVVPISNASEITILPPGTVENSLVAPVIVGGFGYAVDISSTSIVKINLTDKNTERLPFNTTHNPVIGAAEGTASILFGTASGELISFNKANNSIATIPWQQTKASSTQALALYASKLYSLDAEHNQIWHSQKSGNGYGAESAYIKAANTALQGAIGIAIDSNVYVLKNDGTLLRFLSGGQEGFSLSAIEPPLRAASGIWTSIDSPNIYISDPADKRILIFDKSGNLKSQLTSPLLNAPKQLSVDESNKRLIVVDGNRLLLVPLP